MIEIDDSARLTIRAGFEVIPVDDATVLVRSPDLGVRVGIEGMGAEALAGALRSLDGSRAMRTVRGHGPRLEGLVRELVARDVVRVEMAKTPPDGQTAFMARDHDDPDACLRRLRASRVVVCGDVPIVHCVARDLAAAGVRQVDVIRGGRCTISGPPSDVAGTRGDGSTSRLVEHRGADVLIACLASPRDPLAETVSTAASTAGVAWLHLLAFGGTGIVGPLFIPNEGPCLQCLWSRELANWADPELTALYYETIAHRETHAGGHGGLPACSGLVGQWGVLEVTKYLARFTAPALLGALLRLDFTRPGAVLHRVLRLPRCRGCSPVLRRPVVSGQIFAGGT